MWLLCVAAHQPAGVQAVEAQALYQTANPAAEAMSFVTEAQRSAPFSKTSTWTGLVNLDKAGVPSIAGINNSSEISEEHVVIHLRSEEGWEERQDGTSQPSQHSPNRSNTLGLSDLEGLESHGGSAHEEEDGSFFESDTPQLSSSTPQPQTGNSILADFVNTLMRPFKYWTGGKEGEEKEQEPTVPEESASENQTQGEAPGRNLSLPKPNRNKGSMDNAIMEHRSGTSSYRGPTTGVESPEEGLSEQEKEVMPRIRLVPAAVQNTEQSDTSPHSEEGVHSTSTSQTTVKGMNSGFIFNL